MLNNMLNTYDEISELNKIETMPTEKKNKQYLFDIDLVEHNGTIQHLEKFTLFGLTTLLKLFGHNGFYKEINIRITKNPDHEKF